MLTEFPEFTLLIFADLVFLIRRARSFSLFCVTLKETSSLESDSSLDLFPLTLVPRLNVSPLPEQHG